MRLRWSVEQGHNHCELARESAMCRLRVINIRYGSYGVSFHCMFYDIYIPS